MRAVEPMIFRVGSTVGPSRHFGNAQRNKDVLSSTCESFYVRLLRGLVAMGMRDVHCTSSVDADHSKLANQISFTCPLRRHSFPLDAHSVLNHEGIHDGVWYPLR